LGASETEFALGDRHQLGGGGIGVERGDNLQTSTYRRRYEGGSQNLVGVLALGAGLEPGNVAFHVLGVEPQRMRAECAEWRIVLSCRTGIDRLAEVIRRATHGEYRTVNIESRRRTVEWQGERASLTGVHHVGPSISGR
jgi:hypothetical protein